MVFVLTTFKIKKVIDSENFQINLPELSKFLGKEAEILIILEGNEEVVENPSPTVQNSKHVAGSVILDEEAILKIFENRFK